MMVFAAAISATGEGSPGSKSWDGMGQCEVWHASVVLLWVEGVVALARRQVAPQSIFCLCPSAEWNLGVKLELGFLKPGDGSSSPLSCSRHRSAVMEPCEAPTCALVSSGLDPLYGG